MTTKYMKYIVVLQMPSPMTHRQKLTWPTQLKMCVKFKKKLGTF